MRVACLALGALACLAANLSFGQQDSNSPALDESAGRSARLVANAKREGALSLYASMAEKDLMRLVSEFERRYGIKVKVWRSGKNNVLRRAVTEARAGRFEVDVVHNPSPEMELLHRERLLQEVRSPYQNELIPEAVAPHREWAGPRVYIFVQAYNTKKVKPEELPKTFGDLLDPRWKGRIAVEAKEQEWFFTLVREMGEEAGLKFFRDLVATNGLTVRNGNALLNNLVVAGEIPLELTLYSYLPEQSKRSGAPIDWFALAPTVAYTDGIGAHRVALGHVRSRAQRVADPRRPGNPGGGALPALLAAGAARGGVARAGLSAGAGQAARRMPDRLPRYQGKARADRGVLRSPR